MVTKEQLEQVKLLAFTYYDKANIMITETEKDALEIADFGLSDIFQTGLEIITYVNTDRCCAKELVLLPHQTCPEHRHPALDNGYLGKEETFRCRYGKVFLYVEGDAVATPACTPPKGSEEWYTVWHEIELKEGEQYTLAPNILHWFQSGADGAIVSEFSTKSIDELDIFTNPNINRIPEIEV